MSELSAIGRTFGPPPKPPRCGDKEQARQRVNVLVRTGRLAHPNTLPCCDCGHAWGVAQHAHTLSITVDQLQVECRSLEARRVIERHGDRWRRRRSDIRAWNRGVRLV